MVIAVVCLLVPWWSERQAAARNREEQRRKQEEESLRLQQQQEEEAIRLQQEHARANVQNLRLQQKRAREDQARAAAASLRLEPEEAVTVWCGKSALVQVKLQRQGYAGEIRFQTDFLPELVRVARPVVLDDGEEKTQIELAAAIDAPETETVITVSALLGDRNP